MVAAVGSTYSNSRPTHHMIHVTHATPDGDGPTQTNCTIVTCNVDAFQANSVQPAMKNLEHLEHLDPDADLCRDIIKPIMQL